LEIPLKSNSEEPASRRDLLSFENRGSRASRRDLQIEEGHEFDNLESEANPDKVLSKKTN
jgi:hypothetical protein